MSAILPDKKLSNNTKLEKAFIELGCNSFHKSCEYVSNIPYGRTTKSDDWSLVLIENRGTCSTKHALLKSLADELNLDIQLTVGIYPMRESNTLGVGSVLQNTDFEYIPEAHCYLTFQGERFDFTRANCEAEEPINTFFQETEIQPDEVGHRKKEIHKTFIKKHFPKKGFEEVWLIREKCIFALST
ncbi:hypothetical protein [Parashewanella tropica]|uniref:hypothetical protein n=1 Tax=Parashewanella tropica TaxID=2547970 RepID=UPI00105AB002|nr:hypothetical protein [Parashewanella tropica]